MPAKSCAPLLGNGSIDESGTEGFANLAKPTEERISENSRLVSGRNGSKEDTRNQKGGRFDSEPLATSS